MLVIDTEVKIEENGDFSLISKAPIKKGSTIWIVCEQSTGVYWKRQFINYCLSLDLEMIYLTLESSYLKNGVIYQLFDKTKYIKHSLTPNLAMLSADKIVTIEEIEQGVELTLNHIISFDLNDFRQWLPNDMLDKAELIELLKKNLLIPGKPRRKLLA